MSQATQQEFMDAIREGAETGDHSKPVLELMRRHFTVRGFYPDWELARMVIVGLTEHGSQPYRARKKQMRLAKSRKVNIRLPAPKTLSRRIIKPEADERTEFQFPLGHDPFVVAETFQNQYMAIIKVFCDILDIKDDETYITIDSSPSVNFGYLRIDHEGTDLSNFTERGLWASPIMRSHRGRSNPHFRGSSGGSEALHFTLHTLDSRISLPIAVRQLAYEDNDAAIAAVIPCLEALPVKPLFIVWDKEYTNDGAVVDIIRNYADHRGVWVVGPKARPDRIQRFIQAGWDSPERKKFNNEGEENWWYQDELRWSKGAKGIRPFWCVVIYEIVPDKYGEDEDAPGWIVQKGIPGVQPTIAGFALTSNFKVTDDTIQWFASVPPRRWGCESLFARFKGFMGRSRAQTQFPFEMAYGSAFLILGCYGLWRGFHGRRLPLHHPDVSHDAYLELLQADLRVIR